MTELAVGLVQHRCGAGREENLAASIAGIREAHQAGARLVVLPELHTSLYFCQEEDAVAFELAEPVPGPTTRQLAGVARELSCVIVASVFERRAAGLYHNTAVVLETDGSIAGVYRKTHIPDDPGYYEKYYFTPGDLGIRPIDSSVGRLGLLICWDQWFPEAARLMALADAEVLIYPSAIGWDPRDDADERRRQRDAWVTVQRGHAVANGLPLVSVNRCGVEASVSAGQPGIEFWGNSFVAGCQGELLVQAGTEPAAMVARLDGSRSESVRRLWPFFRDRRLDCYGDLTKRFRDQPASGEFR